MKHTISIGQAHVFDKVLNDKTLDELWLFMNHIPYARTDAQLWTKVWNIHDGAILRGPNWECAAPDWNINPPPVPPNQPQQLPSNPAGLLALRDVILKLCQKMKGMPEVNRLAFLPYVWPPKASISWHTDGSESDQSRIGAFTFYVHKNWNCEWGGEFLLSETEGSEGSNPFDNSALNKKIMDTGYGTWISPKRNRLLINPNNMFHKVTKTTENADPRLTIQGFLYR